MKRRMSSRVLGACAVLMVAASAAARPVPPETMRAIYEEVDTPFKYGLVLAPEKGEMLDNPMVFRHGDAWYMMYIRFDGKGYETWLATSRDLLAWKKLGCIFKRGAEGAWDAAQADGWPLLLDPRWEGPNTLTPFQGKYWMMYLGGAAHGYETDPLSTGVAWTDDPSAVKPWTRHAGNPVLRPSDPDARPFERKTIYKHYVVEDPARACGGRFVSFYNAKQDGVWQEKIGMAVSDDLLAWRRVGAGPVIDDCRPGKPGISGDPMIRRIGDVWVMFYFGFQWKDGLKGAFDTFACSYDLKEWTKWTGDPLVKPSRGWFVTHDTQHAHKPWVIKHDGVVYHYYCAVGKQGRGLALATSRDLRQKDLFAGDDRLHYADPHVLYAEGRYFAYGTHRSNEGITVSESTDLVHWQPLTGKVHGGFALYKADSYGSEWFWAPECYRTGDRYTLFYSAEGRCCLATGASPRGPFVQTVKKPLMDDCLSIDNSFFTDDDGTPWMVYVKMENGNRIWLAQLERGTLAVKPQTRRQLLEVSEPWELSNPRSRVAEGPFLVKEGGLYYLTYSANDYRDPNYGIGLAVSTCVTGPYVKAKTNPVLQNRWGLRGIGHHSFFKDKDGAWRIVFHAHHSEGHPNPRVMCIGRVTFRDGTITLGDDIIRCTTAPGK